MNCDTDVLVIGAGPAGSSVAIRLAGQGWRVTLVEQSTFPRQKVCGECLGPASLEMLDELGVGALVRELAGPPLRQVAWMIGKQTVVAQMPACRAGLDTHGCAIGRDSLDLLLLEQARSQGVNILQPVRVRAVNGIPGELTVVLESRQDTRTDNTCGSVPHNDITREHTNRPQRSMTAAVVIDAHGSWERGPEFDAPDRQTRSGLRTNRSELLAFKTTYQGTDLDTGLLPVLCLPGGYGGMVVSNRGRTTLACCIRRDTLYEARAQMPGRSAGDVVEVWLRDSCRGVDAALRRARREESWYAVGPLRIGYRADGPAGIPRIGNAAAEAHPLIGEGICMALQSAAILAKLFPFPFGRRDAAGIIAVQRCHTMLCRRAVARRMRLAQLYAYLAMRPSSATTSALLMKNWPGILTVGARWAGKAWHGMSEPTRKVSG